MSWRRSGGECSDGGREGEGGFGLNTLFSSPPHRYNYVPADAIAWKYRGALVLLEIQTLQPDVVALQEVGANAFAYHMLPGMEALNYQGFHVRNPSTEGVALFWKKDRFKQIAKTELHMHQKAKTLVQQATEANLPTGMCTTIHLSLSKLLMLMTKQRSLEKCLAIWVLTDITT